MPVKTFLSKKVAAIALAGTIGLGAVGGATYAAAPGLMDKIVGVFITWGNGNLDAYKQEQLKTVPNKVSDAFYKARDSFAGYYDGKITEAKKKIDDDVNAYVKEKGTVTDDERKDAESRISQSIDKKRDAVTTELKAAVDAEFKK